MLHYSPLPLDRINLKQVIIIHTCRQLTMIEMQTVLNSAVELAAVVKLRQGTEIKSFKC